MARIAFQSRLRAACITLLDAYGTAVGINLQTYPGRPSTLYPPTAFVDRIDERIDYTASLRQRHPVAQVVVVWGLFDSAEAVAQRDAFVDGFLDTATEDPDAANVATLIELNQVQDEPVFNPDWGNEAQRNTSYYATRLFVEGLALEGD
jgi:hypothetical protein